MKNLLYGWIGIILLFLWSCSKEEGEGKRALQVGKQVFDHTESTLGISLSFFDLSLRMNAYIESTRTDSIRNTENCCFPEYNICCLSDRNWIVTDGKDTVFRLETDDLALTLETARWQVESRLPDCQGKGIITCTGWGKWQLELKEVKNGIWNSQVVLTLQHLGETIPQFLDLPDFAITGSGQSQVIDSAEQGKNEIINFEVAEPLRKTNPSRYLFDNGLVYMKLKKRDMETEKPVKAELKTFPGEERVLQITYEGECTDW